MRENTVCPTCPQQIRFPTNYRNRIDNNEIGNSHSNNGGNIDLQTLNEATDLTMHLMIHMLLRQNWCQLRINYPILLLIPLPIIRRLLVRAIHDPDVLNRLENIGLNIRSLAGEIADSISRSLENAQ